MKVMEEGSAPRSHTSTLDAGLAPLVGPGSVTPIHPFTRFSSGAPGTAVMEGGAHPGGCPTAAHHQGPITRLSHTR